MADHNLAECVRLANGGERPVNRRGSLGAGFVAEANRNSALTSTPGRRDRPEPKRAVPVRPGWGHMDPQASRRTRPHASHDGFGPPGAPSEPGAADAV